MKYFIMFLQLTLIFLAFSGVICLMSTNLSWMIKVPVAAVVFSATMTFAFACDEYHSKKDKLLQ